MISDSVSTFYRVLRSPNGLTQTLAEVYEAQGLPSSALQADQIQMGRLAGTVTKNTEIGRSPSFRVYCDKVENDLTQKFTRFSGIVWLAVEVQATHEHLDDLVSLSYATADAVALTVERNRGQLAESLQIPGRYQIQFEPPKNGGKGFTQVARVLFPVNVTRK